MVESGLTDLMPMGAVRYVVRYYNSETNIKPSGMNKVQQELDALYPDIDYLLNTKFYIYPAGHPERNNDHCRVIGDAYKKVK